MKKLLGISLIAVLTAAPAFAVAADVNKDPVHHDTDFATTTQAPKYKAVAANEATDDFMASAGYVKGAYNAAIKAVNQTYDTLNTAISDEAEARNEADGAINTKIGTTGWTEDGFILKDVEGTDDDIVITNVTEGLTNLQGQIDSVTGNYAKITLENIDTTGQANISAKGTVDLANENYDDNTVGKALVDHESDITTLKGNSGVTGSVENKIKLNAASADYDLTDRHYTDGTASTVTGALNDLDARVNTNTTHIGTMGNLEGVAAGKTDLVQAINAVSSSMTDDFAKQPNVQATIANSTVTVMTEWGSDTVKKRHIDAADYVEDTKVEGIMTGESAVNGKLTN